MNTKDVILFFTVTCELGGLINMEQNNNTKVKKFTS